MKNMIRAMIILLLPVILSSCGTAGTDSGTSTVSGTAVSSGTVAANVTEKTTTAAIEGEWKTAYQSYLNEIYKSSKSTKYYLYYFCKNIDGAGAPELFVIDHAVEDGDQLKVYTYKDDVEEIGSRFLNGTTRLLYSEDPSCPGVFTFDVGGGLERYGYITVQDGKLLESELWNEDYSGFHKDRERIEELSSDKLLISESKKVYKENQDIEKILLNETESVREDNDTSQ